MKIRWLQAGFILLLSTAAEAQPGSSAYYFGGVAFGYTTLEFDAKLDSRPIFGSVAITGGVRLDNYSLVLSYADSASNTSISEEEDIGDAGRSDLDLTLFYPAGDAWNFFVGYKDSETDIDFALRDDTTVRNEFYREEGWFAGVTYQIRLDSAGTLGLSLGYVDLSTDDLFKADTEEVEDGDITDFDDLTGRQKGDADGWSYAINWLVPVNENLFVNTTYKINDYDQEITVDGTTFKADQKLTFFNVGIIYLF